MKGMIDEFDTSDYKNNIYGIFRVKKIVLGKLKDELIWKILDEFIGLESKLYTYKIFEYIKEIKIANHIYNIIIQQMNQHL